MTRFMTVAQCEAAYAAKLQLQAIDYLISVQAQMSKIARRYAALLKIDEYNAHTQLERKAFAR